MFSEVSTGSSLGLLAITFILLAVACILALALTYCKFSKYFGKIKVGKSDDHELTYCKFYNTLTRSQGKFSLIYCKFTKYFDKIRVSLMITHSPTASSPSIKARSR